MVGVLVGDGGVELGACDLVARRLAAVQLVESKAVRQRQVAAVFGVDEDTVIISRGQYAAEGTAGLAGRRPGPKEPSKLTGAKRDEIRAACSEGLSLQLSPSGAGCRPTPCAGRWPAGPSLGRAGWSLWPARRTGRPNAERHVPG